MTAIERVVALLAEWDAIEVQDEWHAADLWSDAPDLLRAALHGPGTPATVEVAPEATDDAEGPQNGCEHDWMKRGNRADPWVMCFLCGETRNGWTDEQRREDRP